MKNVIKDKFESYKLQRQKNKEIFKKASNYEVHEPNDDIAISVQHLSVIFKTSFNNYKVAANDISFDVKKGSFHGFIGDNGAGKTTTIRSILGFYPTLMKGKIFIDGLASTNINSKTKIGYIPEVAIFPRKLTVREYLTSLAKISKVPIEQVKTKVNNLMEKYGFNDKELNKSPAFMSSGQKKKVLLMQALLNDPDILIMDEPAANLDPSARLEFYESIKELNKQGKTIFISSHIILELERYIDSFTVLSHGKVLHSEITKNKNLLHEFNIKLKLADNSKILNYFDKENIQYKFDNEYLICKLDESQKQKMLKEIVKRELNLIELKENRLSLNEMFFKITNGE